MIKRFIGCLGGFFSFFKKRDEFDSPVISGTPNEPIVLSGTPIEQPVVLSAIGHPLLTPTPLMVPFTTDPAYLDPRMRKDFETFMERVREKKIKIKITCTARLYQCQVALYAQGRQPLDEINKLRSLIGMRKIGDEEAKNKVTWTLVSKHLVNFDDSNPDNDYSQAFDFVIMNRAKAIWSPKVDTNRDKIPDYEQVGKIAESLGWVWGGRWKKKDLPHIQLGSKA